MGILTKYLEKIRERKIKPFIDGYVLDIGCGPAKAITYKNVSKYYGIELNKKDVIKLSKKYPRGIFYSKNLEKDEINLKEKVNVVIMSAFIEHIFNYENSILQAVKNLKNDGIIVITTPTKFGDKVHRFGASIGLFSKEAVEDHKKMFTKKDFEEISKKFNLKIRNFSYFELFCNQLVVFEK